MPSRDARLAYNRAYYERNKERMRARHKRYYREHRAELCAAERLRRRQKYDETLAYQRAYRERNKAKLAAQRRADWPRKKEQARRYHAENAEVIRQKRKAYRDRNREKIHADNVRRYWANPEKERARVKAYQQKIRRMRPNYGAGKKAADLAAFSAGKAGALAQLVATEAQWFAKRVNFALVIEDVVQDALVELLSSPPPQGEEKRQVRRLLRKYSSRNVYRSSGLSFEESPGLKRTMLGERYEVDT